MSPFSTPGPTTRTVASRMPNLFVVGAPKSGTTGLHAALARAPQAFMSPVKEPGFFSSDRQFQRGTEHYLRSYFADAASHRLRGESTPWYLYSERACARIGELLANHPPQIVIMLRRPTDRAYSMYLDQQRVGNERREFITAVEEEIKQIESGELRDDVRQRYLWCGRYSSHLRRWREAFGDERVHIHLTDDLRSSTNLWATLARQLGHDLGPNQLGRLGAAERNIAGPLRWPGLDRRIRSLEGRDLPWVRHIRRMLPAGWDRRAAQAVFAQNQPRRHSVPSVPPTSTMRMLDEYFASEVLELQRVLDRPLAGWMPENIVRG